MPLEGTKGLPGGALPERTCEAGGTAGGKLTECTISGTLAGGLWWSGGGKEKMLGSEGSWSQCNELRPGSQEDWSPILTGGATLGNSPSFSAFSEDTPESHL